MGKTRVYLLDGGSLVLDGFHMFWNRGPAGEVRFPCYSVLVDHPDGRFLFDTGFDAAHVDRVLPFEKPMQSPNQTIVGQLALIGLGSDDIDAIVNSHFHFDHCGGNRLFPHAKTICHEAEFEAARAPEPFEHLGYSDMSFAPEWPDPFAETPGQRADPANPADPHRHPGRDFELVSSDTQIVDGVHLLETPGHTAGHCSLMVELAGRAPMLFTADACYSRRNLAMKCISGFHRDPAKDVRSMARLESLAEEDGAELFFSHDRDSYPDYVVSPRYYS